MLWIKVGICMSGLTIFIGAFGAHGLKPILIKNNTMDIFKTAVLYQMFHSLSLIISGILIKLDLVYGNVSSLLFLIGTLVFCGSLYILSVTGIKWLGAVTPIGGVLFLGGWVTLFLTLR